MSQDQVYDLLNRICYSLSYGQIPKVSVPSRNKQFNRYMLMGNESLPFYCEDLFDGMHMHANYRAYILSTLGQAIRVANRSDFNENTATVFGACEYFILTCPTFEKKLIYFAPTPNVVGMVPTKRQIADSYKERKMTSITPSNMSASELIHLRNTTRPYGEM